MFGQALSSVAVSGQPEFQHNKGGYEGLIGTATIYYSTIFI